MGSIEKAKGIAAEAINEHKLRCHYQLGLYFESQNQVIPLHFNSDLKYQIYDAIHHFEEANCYHQAIRLAREHNQTSNLVRLALKSDKDAMHRVAM